jgi:hypothetical protein
MIERLCIDCCNPLPQGAHGLRRYCDTCRKKQVTYRGAKYDWYMRYRRVLAKRRHGKIICFWCEQPLPPEKLKKHKEQKFCNATCANAHKRATGGFHRLSRHGWAKQHAIQRATGHAPGYGKRTYRFDQMSPEERRLLSNTAAESHWEGHQNDPKWSKERRYYWRKKLQATPRLLGIMHAEVQQTREEGLDESDVLWMAAGAVIRECHEQGVIGEEPSPEVGAAIIALVKQEMKAMAE